MIASRRRMFRRLLNLERFEERLVPALITVSNLNASGAGSLRDAVGAANATPGADTIDFAPGLSGVINLNPGAGGTSLNINDAVTIFGPGPDVITVSANGKSRVFNLSGAPDGAAIYISGVGITGGRAVGSVISGGVGAGIYIGNENVTIDRCRISGNVADRSGGGIAIGEHFYTSGVGGSAWVSIYNSTISGNSALQGGGGGISAYGESFGAYSKRAQSLWVENSTISGNTANWSLDLTSYYGGGGVSFLGKVGSGYLAFANTTITDNKVTNGAVGGAILGIALNGTINFLNSTIAYNQSERPGASGIRIQQNFDTSAGNIQAQSSIIANNTQIGGTESRDLSSLYGTTLSAFDCIIGNATYTGISISGTGNQTGTAAAPLDSKLGPLQGNGGPNPTRMPLAGSPAINKGSLATLIYNPTNDGRGVGYPRSLDGAIDVGAVEYTDWVVRNNKDKDSGSLYQRILDANAFVGEQTITFDPIVFPSNKSTTIQTPGGTPISDSLTINGPGAAAVTLQRSGPNESMFVAKSAGLGAVVTMSGLTFTGGGTTGIGGVITAKDQVLNFTDCVFTKNNATSNGGAIAFENNTAGQLNLLRCSFTSNTTELNGGAVFFAGGGGLSIIDSTFSGNQTKSGSGNTQGGGAVAFIGTASAPLLIRNSTFANNTSVGQGGAIFLTSFAGTLNVENSTIAYNSAAGSFGGGGIGRSASTGTVNLSNSILSNNTHTTGSAEDIFSSAAVVANFSAIGIPFNTPITGDATSNALLGQNFRLGTLGNVGGPTQTIPLLPGSPLFNAGSSTVPLDQRGKSRVGAADIGAFESQGYTVTVVSGTPQSTVTNTAFISPLVAKIVAANAVEPVEGGVITFTPPGSGASATLAIAAATIALGQVSTTATANGIGGSYNVTASAGSSSVNFALTNKVLEAPSLVVTTTADVVDNFDLKTSLREAIAFSNSKVGTDTITFDAAVFAAPQTIALTNGELVLNDAVTIAGPGAALVTVSGNKLGRVFNTIAAATNAAINISGLTIANAQTALRGGAVFADDQFLTFTDCVLTGNSSGAGGAIAFDITTTGRLTLQRTTVSNNTASFGGGGVYFFGGGSFTIANSTFSGNKSNGTNVGNGGGGIYFNGSAGTKTLEVRNSTISGNTAASDGGGICIRNHGGSLYMANSTVVNNIASGSQGGGGIAQVDSTGFWNVSSSIISNNTHTAGLAEDLLNLQTGFVGSLSNCAIGTTVGTLALTLNATTTNLLGKNFLLSPLGNYGGPTQTHALLPGSPAINHGLNNLSLTTDQRGLGFARISGGAPDIGAYEAQPLNLVVTTTNDVDNGDFSADDLSFREALIVANNVPGPDTITFDPTVFATPRTITLGNTLTVADAATITGPGANLLTVSGNNSVRVMLIDTPTSGQKITVSGLTIANGVSGVGSGIYVGDESVTISSCAIVNNLATMSAGGGGVFITLGANALIERCTVSGNTAVTNGGIYSASPLVVRNSTIANNTATSTSGAIRVGFGGGALFLENSTVVNNSAATFGGGINAATSFTAINSVISGNIDATGANDVFFGTVGPTVIATNSAIGAVFGGVTDKGGNILNQPHANLKLAPLANNGGPTQTIALLPGSPLINKGSNPANLTTDQRGAAFLRVVGTAADIGAFEKQDVPRGITNVVVNDGSAQRSRVTSLTVTFDQPVTLPVNPVDAFQLKRQSDNANVALNANVAGNVVTLTFTGGPVDFGSLADGRYTLTALASKIMNFDGNGDAVAGDNFVMTGTPANGLFRLFGDSDGNGTVNAIDFNAVRLTYGSSGPSIFDFNNDGQVTANDFNEFRLRYGVSI